MKQFVEPARPGTRAGRVVDRRVLAPRNPTTETPTVTAPTADRDRDRVTVTVEPPVEFEPEEVDEIVEEVIEEEGLADFANLDQEVDPAQCPERRPDRAGGRPDARDDGRVAHAVIDDIDAYWQETFAAEGLPPPPVFYMWPAKGEQVDTGCQYITDDDAALYCGVSDTIFVSQDFAFRLWDGLINTTYGPQQSDRLGDFAVAYVLAHEFGHSIQAELGLLGVGLPGLADRAPGRLLRRQLGELGVPQRHPRGGRPRGGARDREPRRRLRVRQPAAPRHARGARRRVLARLGGRQPGRLLRLPRGLTARHRPGQLDHGATCQEARWTSQ